MDRETSSELQGSPLSARRDWENSQGQKFMISFCHKLTLPTDNTGIYKDIEKRKGAVQEQ